MNGSVAAGRDVTAGRDASARRRTATGAAQHRTGCAELRLVPAGWTSPRIDRRLDEAEIRRRASAERQDLAGALHDEIGPLLFAIAASTQRAQTLHRDDLDALCRTVDDVADHVRNASDRLRELLAGAAPADPCEAVPTAVECDLADLRNRTGTAAQLIVRGRVRRLSPRLEHTVLNCLRQALFNVERHAHATAVVVTLDYTPDQVTLVVLDDGRGIHGLVGTNDTDDAEDGVAPAALPEGDRRWGFTSMARQAERNGGEVTLHCQNGGTALRLRLPT